MHPPSEVRVAPRLILLLLLCAARTVSALEAVAMMTAPPLARRAHPAEARADFVGWYLQADGSFSASFCWTQGETVTTIGTVIECCPPAPSSCYVGISCSSRYQVSTIIATPAITSTQELDCAVGAVPGNYCATGYQYDSETNTTAIHVSIGCMAYPGLYPARRYYKTLMSGAVTTLNEPAYSPGEQATTTPFPTLFTTSSRNSSGSSGTSASGTGRAGSTGTVSPSEASPPSSSGTPASASASGELSRSDQIAIGIGLGVGLPTVLIGILAWFYPRQMLGRGKVPVQAPEQAPSAN